MSVCNRLAPHCCDRCPGSWSAQVHGPRDSLRRCQLDLSARLRIRPSRLVVILDNLEKRKLVERKPNPEDRRLYSLHLTKNGGEILERIGRVAREHQDALLAALSAEEREHLTGLLHKIADQQGLAR